MSAPLIHPSHAQLFDFAQGRLSPAEQLEVEAHVAECDECCLVLAETPDDSLLARLRANETFNVAADQSETEPPARVTVEVPRELVEHPRYRILKVLGVGGMGVVFQAEHRLMERAVALKVINRALLARPEFVERFEQEVKAAAKLAHPNIVVAHDAEQVGDLHFLVMEYVDGQSLARIVEKKGPLPVVNACHYIRQAAQGLQHAHEKGMVHRDIKPQNLMLTKRGQIKVLDFGLARLRQIDDIALTTEIETDASANTGSLTRAGSLLGTPDYMAPEQAADPRDADARSDIYSLGCTLYFLLTGQPPFAAEKALRKLHAHQQDAMQAVSDFRDDVPPELQSVLDQMVAKAPEARFQTAAEVVQAIAPLARGTVLPPAKTEVAQRESEVVPVTSAKSGEARADADRTGTESFDSLPRERVRPPIRRGHLRHTEKKADWSSWLRRHYSKLIGGACCVLLLLVVGNELRRSFSNSDEPANGSPDSEPSLTGLLPQQRPVGFRDVAATQRGPVSKRPQRVGLAVWSEGFVWLEYKAVREALEANGVRVVVVSDAAQAESAWGNNETVRVDQQLGRSAAQELDALVIVGGKQGVFRFFDSPELRQLIETMLADKKLIAGIGGGAAPLVKGGFTEQHTVAVAREMQLHAERLGAKPSNEPAVRDGQIVTGRDAGAAAEFVRLLLK